MGIRKNNFGGFAGIEILLVVALIGVLGSGTIVVSDTAVPGDLLYSVDTSVEELQERFITDPEAKLEFRLKQAEERADELATLEKEIQSVAEDVSHQELDVALNDSQYSYDKAEELVASITSSVETSNTSSSNEKLYRLEQLLQHLQQTQQVHRAVLAKLKPKVENPEILAKILALENEVLQRVRIEEEIDPDTGDLVSRIKVYKIDPSGEEELILDLREDNFSSALENEPDEEIVVVSQDDSALYEANLEDLVTDKVSVTPVITKEIEETPHEIEQKRPEVANVYEIQWRQGEFNVKAKEIFSGDTIEFVNQSDSAIKLASDQDFSSTQLEFDEIPGNGGTYRHQFSTAGRWVLNLVGTDHYVKILVR
ncbi:hypothetical protein KC571_02765 [candidate division WWE3 bacterium]|uniref:DUF5667 domain-containing protein n=1 Tax=candidate division WWE3 bacterium TaxID=2053526 RepID=A0A955LGU3_UNCKA|nr:hypothetical protein [candidate division WWE3 bacterium]